MVKREDDFHEMKILLAFLLWGLAMVFAALLHLPAFMDGGDACLSGFGRSRRQGRDRAF